MESHQFVYLIIKDARTGRVFTKFDNRDSLEDGKNERKPFSVIDFVKSKATGT